jgi:hypothetical protein
MQVEGQIALQLITSVEARRPGGALRLSLGLRALITRFRKRTEEKSPGEFADLIARLDRWRRARNRLVLALGAGTVIESLSSEVTRLIEKGEELAFAVRVVRERFEADPPKTTKPALTPDPKALAPQTPRQRIATRYVGSVGFWESPVHEVFSDGPVSFGIDPNLGVSVTINRVRHSTTFKTSRHGWMSPRRSSRYPERIRRYVDAMGEMWWCQLHDRVTPFSMLARVPSAAGTAASAQFEGTLAASLEATLRTAVERVETVPTLTLEFSYGSEELGVQLSASEGTGWVGTWRQLRPVERDRPCESGSVRGRLFRDGSDALFVGEWRQMDATYTCVVALDHERDVYT